MPDTVNDDPDPEPEPDWFRAFLVRLRDLLRGRLAADEYEAAVRTARSSIGGQARAHRLRHGGSPQPAAACEDAVITPRLAKAETGYRTAVDPERSCATCRFYQLTTATCTLVEGTIEPGATCDLWHAPVIPMAAPPDEPGMGYGEVSVGQDDDGRPRLFAELPLTEPPDRIAILPRPGIYRHPTYGEIELTPERIARMVANHNRRVYGQDVPILIDAEHNLKLYGAMGYLGPARIEPDGSASAEVTWTERGAQLIREGRVRYVSPEWYLSWTDPVSGSAYRDVLVGVALTTRPFFKPDALPPLAAQDVAQAATEARPGEEERAMHEQQQDAVSQPAAEARNTDEERRQFAERIAALEAERQQLAERVAQWEERELVRRFRDEILGRSEANGTPWAFAGDHAEAYVAILRALPEEPRQQFVAVMRRLSEALAAAQAQLAREQGSDAIPRFGDSHAEIDALVARRLGERAGLTRAEALREIFAERPDLYERYRREAAVRV